MKRLLKLLLNIKLTIIDKVEIVGGPDIWGMCVIVHVHPTKGQLLRCPICAKRMPYKDGGRGIRDWRALDLGVMRVYLRGKAPRVECAKHGVLVASVPWARHDSWFTYAFEEQVAWMVKQSTQKTVISQIFRIDWETVGSIAKRVEEDVRKKMPSPFDGLVNIGIDETSYRRGHKYLTVVVNHDTGAVIWAHVKHGKEVLTKFFELLTEKQRASIENVTGDGAGWITECVEEFCPNAKRLLDAFHIVAWATDALDNVRRRVVNDLKKEEGKEKKEKRKRGRPKKGEEVKPSASATVKKSRFAVLKNPEDLTENQQAKIELLALENGQLYRAYIYKERLRLLLKLPVDDATPELDSWLSAACRSRIPEIVELSKKIRRHRARIIDTVASGLSNARVEAVNNKIKVTIKLAYGFRNLENLISLIYLRCSILPLSLPGRRPHKKAG